jgi:2-keto-4-pentenoate hydratase
MNSEETGRAARLLANADRNHSHIAALPDGLHPGSPSEAMALQAQVVSLSGETVAGWKVATTAEGVSTWGAIYARDVLASPAKLEAGRMPMRGVEGEVAFRFVRDLPARTAPYSREEIEAVLTAFPAIEIVDSRFESYAGTPATDRLADRMSNGGIVIGKAEAGADKLDLSQRHVTLTCDGKTILDQVGGHSRGDPLLPAIEFIHARQEQLTFRTGQFITAGTLTGMIQGTPGQRYEVTFDGLGGVGLTFA